MPSRLLFELCLISEVYRHGMKHRRDHTFFWLSTSAVEGEGDEEARGRTHCEAMTEPRSG